MLEHTIGCEYCSGIGVVGSHTLSETQYPQPVENIGINCGELCSETIVTRERNTYVPWLSDGDK